MPETPAAFVRAVADAEKEMPWLVSPAIVGPHARFDNAVDNLVAGKTMNAGQTCIAPDYVLVPRGKEQAFIERARARMSAMYPDFSRNRDFLRSPDFLQDDDRLHLPFAL